MTKILQLETIYNENGDKILDRSHEIKKLTFNVFHNDRTSKCYLIEDQAEDKMHILTTGATIKSTYTEADYEEKDRLSKEEPLTHGDTVSVKGKEYLVYVNGNFCDLGYLMAIN